MSPERSVFHRGTTIALEEEYGLAVPRMLPVYLFILLVFLNRYVFGLYIRLINKKRLHVVDDRFEPTVSARAASSFPVGA